MILSHRQSSLIFYAFIAVLFTVAWQFQSFFMLNCDVSWDLLIAKYISTGGSYSKDFFDWNPPLVFYLYLPTLIFIKMFSLSVPVALRLYIFLLTAVGFFVSLFFVRKIFLPQDKKIFYGFILGLLCTFLFFPTDQFAEREHLLLILSMPYLLLAVIRLQGNTIPRNFCIAIGLLGGLAFSIKPYFLLTPALLELYYMYSTRNIWAWVRPEVIALGVFVVFYTAMIVYFFPDFLVTIIPLSLDFYYSGFHQPWMEVIFTWKAYFCYLVVTLFVILYQQNKYKILTSVLCIATLSFLLVHFFQRLDWMYHILPAFSAAFLMLIILANADPLPKSFLNKSIKLLVYLTFLFPLYFCYHYCYQGMVYKTDHVKLINFLKNSADHKSIYALSAAGQIFSSIDYANVNYVSRFMHIFWAPAVAIQVVKKEESNSTWLAEKEQRLINMVVEDFDRKKPELVFVDVQNFKSYFQWIPFDYLEYFSKNERFKKDWQHYQYLTTIEQKQGTPLHLIEDWNLYIAEKMSLIHVTDIDQPSVVLVGSGNNRVAYFFISKHFMQIDHHLVKVNVRLSKVEVERIDKESGVIKRTTENKALVDDLIQLAIENPVYRFDVYQRKDNVS